MRFSYLSIAEAVTVAAPEKINALGFGLRRFLAASFPTLLNAVLVAQVEASLEELGVHKVRFAIGGPGRKQRIVAEGTVELEDREGFDLRRPLTWTAQIPLTGLPIEEPGAYRVSATFGNVRASYVFVVDQLPQADEGSGDEQPSEGSQPSPPAERRRQTGSRTQAKARGRSR